jgi:acetoacetate decarboxylase
MGFVKTLNEISERYRKNGEFYDAEVLTVFFETKQEIVERLLPSPLKPTALPLGGAFVANYPRTNFGVTYRESALFLLAQYDGEEGVFCLAMPVTDDIALILGREVFGYPKKIAEISLEREGNDVKGWAERRGIRFFEVKAKLSGKFNDALAQQMISQSMGTNPDVIVYNFKYFPAPEREGFDYNPRLVKEVVTRKPKSVEMGEAELILRPSDHDPWCDVEIVRVLGAMYTIGDNTMLPGSVVADVDQKEFAPYAFMKLDSFA